VRLAIHEGYATAKRTINDEDALAAVGQTGVQKLKAMESYKKKNKSSPICLFLSKIVFT